MKRWCWASATLLLGGWSCGKGLPSATADSPTPPISRGHLDAGAGTGGLPTLDGGEPSASDGGIQAVPSPGPAPGAHALASDDAPDALAEDASNLYWVDRNAYCTEGGGACPLHVRMLPKSGGAIRTLATEAGQAFSLSTDDAHVYFGGSIATEGCGKRTCPPSWKLWRVAKNGGPDELLAQGLGTVGQLSVSQGVVYLTGVAPGADWSTYGVLAVAAEAPHPLSILAPGEPSSDVFADGDEVFWTVPDGIRRADRDGGSRASLFHQPGLFPARLGTDGAAVLFLAEGSLWSAPKVGGALQRVERGAAGTPVTSFHALDGRLAWTQGSCLGRRDAAGPQMNCFPPAEGELRGVLLDGSGVFWLAGRQVMALPWRAGSDPATPLQGTHHSTGFAEGAAPPRGSR